MPTYRDEAIVLRTWDLGEADRIISLFTRTRGKVRAVARGVRRTSSKFGSRVEPFSHIDVQLAEGRGSLDVITQSELLHEPLLGLDYNRFTAAEVLVEAAERLVPEDRTPATSQYRLLLGAVVALARPGMPMLGVVDSYLLRAFAIDGQAVVLTECASCGGSGADWFAPQRGGAVCARCRPPSSAGLDSATRNHLTALVVGDWETVRHAEHRLALRCHGLTVAYATWFLERELRSLDFLNLSAG